VANLASTFCQSMGAVMETAIPDLVGKISYLYRNDTAMAAEPLGLPTCNIMWLGETHQPAGNQFQGLAIVEAQVQIDYTFEMPAEEYGIDAHGVLYDAAADVRVAICNAFAAHHSGSPVGDFAWLDLGQIVTDFGVLRSAMGADQGMVSVRPTIKLRRTYNGR